MVDQEQGRDQGPPGDDSSDPVPMDSDLLTAYLTGQAMTIAQLAQLSDMCWQVTHQGLDSPDFIEQVFQEPPQATGVISPLLQVTVLPQLRQALDALPDLSAEQAERLSVSRERLAIALCADDAVPRERRLSMALNALNDASEREPEATRKTTLRWTAELSYRLVSEFKLEALAKTGRLAFWMLAVGSPHDGSALRDLCLCCELCLRELRMEFGQGLNEAERAAGWQAALKDLWPAFDVDLGEDKLDPASRFEALLKRTLWMSMRGWDPAAQAVLEEVLDLFDSMHISRPHKVAAMDQLLAGVSAVVKGQLAIGQPVAAGVKEAVQDLLHATTSWRMLSAKRQALMSQVPALPLEEVFRQMAQFSAVIDGKTLTRHVDELLSPDGDHKHGLALSGGGWRAALFHLGVLARLAECDQLRRLDAISCVSGGSMAGAAYAVRLKALFDGKHDLEIGQADYIEVVEDVIAALSNTASRNLRMQALGSPKAILKMWLKPAYTFTERIAELLDLELFAPLYRPSINLKVKPLEMTRPGHIGLIRALLEGRPLGWPLGPWDLEAAPLGEEGVTFSSTSLRNKLRRAKVPEMTFNATTLNTGHGFRFTGQAHGESPDPHKGVISSRPRLTWMRYDDITAGAALDPERLTLSRIVAASASVPGILPPVLLQRNSQAALLAVADGGVFDNQGLDHLMEARCDHILLSDAAGQLHFEHHPDVSGLPVLVRSSDILMERIRELGYKRLLHANAEGSLGSFTYLHLTKGLDVPPPPATFRPDDVILHHLGRFQATWLTSFGVVRAVQAQLASLRTDLDCFAPLEIQSLMLDGYLQAREQIRSTDPAHGWRFLAVAPQMARHRPKGQLAAVLQAGRRRFGRLPLLLGWWLVGSGVGRWARLRRRAVQAMGLVLAFGLGWMAWPGLLMAWHSTWLAIALLHGLALGLFVWCCPPCRLKQTVVKLAAGPWLLLAMLYAWLVLLVADPIYRRLGRASEADAP